MAWWIGRAGFGGYAEMGFGGYAELVLLNMLTRLL